MREKGTAIITLTPTQFLTDMKGENVISNLHQGREIVL